MHVHHTCVSRRECVLHYVSRAIVTLRLNFCLCANRMFVHRMCSPVSLISTFSSLIRRLINDMDVEETTFPRWPSQEGKSYPSSCDATQRLACPPPDAVAVLDYDADFTPSSSSCGDCLLAGALASTSSGSGGCVVPLEMCSSGTERDASSLPSSFYEYHLLDGAPASASSGDGGVVSMDGSPSATDYDPSFLPTPSSYLPAGTPASVSSDDGDATVPTERFLSVTDSYLSSSNFLRSAGWCPCSFH